MLGKGGWGTTGSTEYTEVGGDGKAGDRLEEADVRGRLIPFRVFRVFRGSPSFKEGAAGAGGGAEFFRRIGIAKPRPP